MTTDTPNHEPASAHSPQSGESLAPGALSAQSAETLGPPWASDHPGRRCNLCTLPVYTLWIDKVPPPGTCPCKVATADACEHNVGAAVFSMIFALQTNSDRVPELRQVLVSRGLDPATIEAYARDWIAIDKEHFQFETAAIKVRSVDLHQWLGQQPDHALRRATQIMVAIAYHLQFAIDDLREDERAAWRARFKRAMRQATRELLNPDLIEDGEFDALGEGDDAAGAEDRAGR